MTSFVVMMCWCHTFCVYFLITQTKNTENLNVLACLVYAVGSVDSLFIILGVFGIAAQVHLIAVQTKSHFQRISYRNLDSNLSFSTIRGNARGRQFFRRHVKSWSLIKIKFFTDNFFECNTPLKLEQFSISQTVNLLVMQA